MKLKELIKSKNITQEQLAKDLSITQSSISQWCIGICRPKIKYIKKIAQLLNVSVEEVLNCFD